MHFCWSMALNAQFACCHMPAVPWMDFDRSHVATIVSCKCSLKGLFSTEAYSGRELRLSLLQRIRLPA